MLAAAARFRLCVADGGNMRVLRRFHYIYIDSARCRRASLPRGFPAQYRPSKCAVIYRTLR